MPRSGLRYAAEMEWRLAAQWAHYRYEDWQMLDGELQSAHVAAYRVAKQAEAVLAHEGAREQARMSRTPRRRR